MLDIYNIWLVFLFGDVFIYVGDFIENGLFEEVQVELSWFLSLFYWYKIFVVWNYDVLLDDVFFEKYFERCYGQNKMKGDFDWGSVIYLQDSVVIFKFLILVLGFNGKDSELERVCIIIVFGSFWIFWYGVLVFQYRFDDGSYWVYQNVKMQIVKLDIVVIYGLFKYYFDVCDFY